MKAYTVTAAYLTVTNAKGKETRIERGGQVPASAVSAETAKILIEQGTIAPTE